LYKLLACATVSMGWPMELLGGLGPWDWASPALTDNNKVTDAPLQAKLETYISQW